MLFILEIIECMRVYIIEIEHDVYNNLALF